VSRRCDSAPPYSPRIIDTRPRVRRPHALHKALNEGGYDEEDCFGDRSRRRRCVDCGLIVNSCSSQWKRHRPGRNGRLAGHEGMVRLAQSLRLPRLLAALGLLVIAGKANAESRSGAKSTDGRNKSGRRADCFNLDSSFTTIPGSVAHRFRTATRTGTFFYFPRLMRFFHSAASRTSGAAARTSASTCRSYLTKLFWNMPTSLRAVASKAALSFHVFIG
jgi:hypothetical protein